MVGFSFPFIWDWYVGVKQLELPAFSKGANIKDISGPQFTVSLRIIKKLAQLFLRAHPLISPDPTQIRMD